MNELFFVNYYRMIAQIKMNLFDLFVMAYSAVRCDATNDSELCWLCTAEWMDELINFVVNYKMTVKKNSECICLLSPTVPSDMMRLMIQSYADYTQPASFRVSVGTWNVNGGKHFRSIAFKHEHITDWLLDLPKIIRSTAPGMSVSLSHQCDFC